MESRKPRRRNEIADNMCVRCVHANHEAGAFSVTRVARGSEFDVNAAKQHDLSESVEHVAKLEIGAAKQLLVVLLGPRRVSLF